MTMLGFWKWGFRASLSLHTAPDDASPSINKDTTYAQFLRSLPSIDTSKKLWLNPLLFNGSLQTIYYGSHNSETQFQVYYGREIFTYADGGVCSLDWAMPKPASADEFARLYKQTLPATSPRLHPRTRFFTGEELERQTAGDAADTRPICVVFHGMAGGSHEPLVRNLAEDLEKRHGRGWDFVVVNSRGCGRTKLTSGKLFSALSDGDVREVLEALKARFPQRPLYTVGFSFGACILSNYLATDGAAARDVVKAAVFIGCPWDMPASTAHLTSSLTGKFLLNGNLVMFLNKLIKSNLAELQHYSPQLYSDATVAQARRAKKLSEWDDLITCKSIGLKDSAEYYREASPARRVSQMRVPSLAINSTDDPTVSPNLPYAAVQDNPNFAMLVTDLGGHLGWVQYSGEFWSVGVACEFMSEFEARA